MTTYGRRSPADIFNVIGVNPLTGVWRTEPFLANLGAFASSTANGGTVATSTAGTPGEMGVLLVHAGTSSATGRASVQTLTNGLRSSANSTIVVSMAARVWVVQTASNNFTTMIGVSTDLTTKTPAGGAFWRGEQGVNSDRWECVSRASSSETTVDSGITIANTNAVYAVVLRGASAVDFYYGTATSPLRLVTTINTNVPANNTQMTGGCVSIGVAGTAATRGWIADDLGIGIFPNTGQLRYA